jgi:hypothetical protein
VVVDSDGRALAAGTFSTALDLGADPITVEGGNDAFVAKLKTNGSVDWQQAMGSTGNDDVSRLALDPSGDTVAAGAFAYEMDVGTVPLQSAGGLDVFVAQLDAGGQTVWAKSCGGPGDQQEPRIAVDHAGNVILGAQFDTAMDCGAGTPLAAGGTDIFLAKLRP